MTTPSRIPAFDPDRLTSFTAGDPALERELLELYFKTAGAYLAQLECAGNDATAWRKLTHALKGASLNIGAIAMGELARAAEAGKPSTGTLAALQDTFRSLHAMLGTPSANPA